MSQAVCLETAGFTSQIRQHIETLDIAPESKLALAAAQLQNVVITIKPARLVIRLDSGRLLSRESLDAFSQALLQEYTPGHLPQMIWDVHYPPNLIGLEEYLNQHWRDFVVLLGQSLPLAEAYLSLVRFSNPKPGRLLVSLPNEMSASALRRINGEKQFGAMLSQRLGTEINVRFEVGDFNEEMKQREALYQRHIREELERLQSQTEEPQAPASQDSNGAGSAWRVVFGRKIGAAPVPVASVREEQKNVVVEGELISFELKTLRTGRQLAIMDLFDQTDTISSRLFLDAGKHLSPEIQSGIYVKLRGDAQVDKYSQDLCLLIRDIMLGKKAQRQDLAAKKRIELHAHTQMSAMDALPSATELVARAAAFGHSAVAITDHGVVQAYPEAALAAAQHKIQVVYGMEGYLVEDDWPAEKTKRPYHVSILVQEQAGIKNLYRLVSHAHLDHFYRHPRIPRSLLNNHRQGLLLGTACEQGEFFQKLRSGATDAELEAIARSYDYLEIMPRANNAFLIREGALHSEDELLDIYRKIYALGKRLDIPVVATGDVHFLDPHDEVYRCILQAGMGYTDAASQAPLFLKTTTEMLEEFAYLGEEAAHEVVIENPSRVLAKIQPVQPLKQTFHPPRLQDAEKEMRREAFREAENKYGKPLPPLVEQRLQREITGICKNDFASLFLIARKLVKKSLEDGYLVGSRGSVGSSLTATMLGITEVNPLPGYYLCPQCHRFEVDAQGRIGADLPDRTCPDCKLDMHKEGFNIPFEVFMGFKGNKLPDIDLNFSGDYQSTAHKYLEEIFDHDHIFRAGTISTVADRIAYGFVKKYLEENKLVLREAEINRLTRGCAGVKKTTGQHPGGIMIVPADMDIYDFTPVQRPADDRSSGVITTHLDYHAIHDALLKLDILGHDDPTSLRRLGDMTSLDVRSIPLDDPDTLKIFSGLDSLHLKEEQIQTPIGTLGIPEFGTEFVRQMLEVTRPTTFSELVRISGLSHGTDVWLNNAADLIKAKTATLSTVISARDDIMNYLISCQMDPALAFEIMESVRKGKGLTPEQQQRMKSQNVPDWYIESCQKIKYMFPKAHAVAYCLMAFRIAYFKVHFPAEFYTNYFSLNAEFFDAELVVHGGPTGVQSRIDELRTRQDVTAKDKNNLVVLEVVREAFARGIRFKPVNLMESHEGQFHYLGDNILLPPLSALAGLGSTCAQRITEERVLKPFRSVEDLSRRTGANKNVVEIMTRHGCLNIMPRTDQTVLF